jgi:hypothetical protein
MLTKSMASVAGAILAAGALACGTASAGDGDDVQRRIEAIKQPASMRRWEKIPWVTDLAEGQRLARREHRPIFLWASGDDPLERC